MRIDDSTLYNPFAWRLAELADPRLDLLRRIELEESLLVCEAEEIAVGRRHLTIVHGTPCDLDESRQLDRFYDVVSGITSRAEWARVRGGDEYVTITIGGPSADELLSSVAAAADRVNPGGWTVTESPYPPAR